MNNTVSQKNQVFWNELCGSGLAQSLGIEKYDANSLSIFDKWFFNFYPYLDVHIPFYDLEGKDVLEIGLGFGSVSQRLVGAGANFCGLDSAVIGESTKIWHHSQIRPGAVIGENCNFGKGVYIDEGVHVGNNVKIQNYVSVYHGVTIEDGVFIGPKDFITDKAGSLVNQGCVEEMPEAIIEIYRKYKTYDPEKIRAHCI